MTNDEYTTYTVFEYNFRNRERWKPLFLSLGGFGAQLLFAVRMRAEGSNEALATAGKRLGKAFDSHIDKLKQNLEEIAEVIVILNASRFYAPLVDQLKELYRGGATLTITNHDPRDIEREMKFRLEVMPHLHMISTNLSIEKFRCPQAAAYSLQLQDNIIRLYFHTEEEAVHAKLLL